MSRSIKVPLVKVFDDAYATTQFAASTAVFNLY